jgi:hypothetical protein
MNNDDRELDFALAEAEQENRLLRTRNERLENTVVEYEQLIRDLTDALRAQAMPPAPMECKTDAEKIAYSYGWFKALELNPARKLWVGLTDEDDIDWEDGGNLKDLVKAIETKLKEKNT